MDASVLIWNRLRRRMGSLSDEAYRARAHGEQRLGRDRREEVGHLLLRRQPCVDGSARFHLPQHHQALIAPHVELEYREHLTDVGWILLPGCGYRSAGLLRLIAKERLCPKQCAQQFLRRLGPLLREPAPARDVEGLPVDVLGIEGDDLLSPRTLKPLQPGTPPRPPSP